MKLARTKARKPSPTAADRDQALHCIPVRNPEAAVARDGDGLLLSYPVEVKTWFQPIFRRLSGKSSTILTRKLQLDALGASVWTMVDGNRSVHEIIAHFQETHRLNRREAELAVTAFFRELGKRGLLAMKPAEPQESPMPSDDAANR